MSFNLKKIGDNEYYVRNVRNGKLEFNRNIFGVEYDNRIIDKNKKVEILNINNKDINISSLYMENLEVINCYIDNFAFFTYNPSMHYIPNLKTIIFNKADTWLLASYYLFKNLDSLKKIMYDKNIVVEIPDNYKCNMIKINCNSYDFCVAYSNDYKQTIKYTNVFHHYSNKFDKEEHKLIKIKEEFIVDNTLIIPEEFTLFSIDDISNIDEFKFNKIKFNKNMYDIDLKNINNNITCIDISSCPNIKIKNNSIKKIIFNENSNKMDVDIPEDLTLESIVYINNSFVVSANNEYETMVSVVDNNITNLNTRFMLKKLKDEHVKNNIIQIPNKYNKINLNDKNIFNKNFKLDLSSLNNNTNINITAHSQSIITDLYLPELLSNKKLSISFYENNLINKIIFKNNNINSLECEQKTINIDKRVEYLIQTDKYVALICNYRSIIIDSHYYVYNYDKVLDLKKEDKFNEDVLNIIKNYDDKYILKDIQNYFIEQSDRLKIAQPNLNNNQKKLLKLINVLTNELSGEE